MAVMSSLTSGAVTGLVKLLKSHQVRYRTLQVSGFTVILVAVAALAIGKDWQSTQ